MSASRTGLLAVTLVSLSLARCDCGGDTTYPDAGTDAGPDADAGPDRDATLPPDPASVAPPLKTDAPTQPYEAYAFLTQGDDPVQTGVAADALQPARIALLRGEVRNEAGGPLEGVRVHVPGHPELGQTLTRTDGRFDLVVNGGSTVGIAWTKAGFLPMFRSPPLTWQETLELPPLIMRALDPTATTVALGSPDSKVHRGSPISDEHGARRASLIFPPNLTAELRAPNGTTQAIDTLTIRATEYTVGPNGPAAMPAELPPSSAYTYAVELTADEAPEGSSVEFSKPIAFYVDNFVGMPVGTAVPVAWWDRRQAWIPADDGKVIKVLEVQGGMAKVDTDGDGLADDSPQLSELRMDEAELRSLAETYAAGTELWRVGMQHFTTYDLNYGVVPPNNAKPPRLTPPVSDNRVDDPSAVDGFGTLDVDGQVFHEAVPIVGTPFRLVYASDRVPGRRAGRQLVWPLLDDAPPTELLRVDVETQIAGRRFLESYDPTPGLKASFEWDGKDAYGRVLQGAQTVTTRIDFIYPGYYALPPFVARSFGLPSSAAGDVPARTPVRLSQTLRSSLTTLGSLDARGLGFGGWSLDVHHVYDPSSRTLYLGDGTRRSLANELTSVVSVVGGACGNDQESGDDGRVDRAGLGWINGLTFGADGSLYLSSEARVRRITPEGIINPVAGTGRPGFAGDGGNAVDAQLQVPAGLAVDAAGALYISDHDNHRIRRVRAGRIETVVGSGEPGFSGDEGPANQAQLRNPRSVAVAADGTLYVADAGNDRIRQVTPDGRIHTLVGCRTCDDAAVKLPLETPRGLALGPDGSLYLGSGDTSCIFRLMPSGRTSTVAGTCGVSGYSGDGGSAVQARLAEVMDLSLASDGTLYVVERCNHRVRAIDPSGLIRTVTGCKAEGSACTNLCDALPAAAQAFAPVLPRALAVAPDGTLVVAESRNRLLSVRPILPGVSLTEQALPSMDGENLFVFDQRGRHLATRNALTGATRLSFTYDDSGRLTGVTDGANNSTEIERDAEGRPVGIVAPFGARTTLELNADGYLGRVVDPTGAPTNLGYAEGGLLNAVTGPDGGTFAMTYGEGGRLESATNPRGATTRLERVVVTMGATGPTTDPESPSQVTVRVTTPLGRTLASTSERRPGSGQLRASTRTDGTRAERQLGLDGSDRRTDADGTVTEIVQVADPTLGFAAPFQSMVSTVLPSGASAVVQRSRQATGPSWVETSSLSGALRSTTRFDASTRTFSVVTSLGRSAQWEIDAAGRETRRQWGELTPVESRYDDRGRLTEIRQGSRIGSLEYDSQGRLSKLIDPIGRENRFTRDAAGRVTALEGPDQTTRTIEYDTMGRIVAIEAPSGARHVFERSLTGRITSYQPPGDPSASMQYEYDLEDGLTRVLGPETDRHIERDEAGRVVTEQAGDVSVMSTYQSDGRVASVVTGEGQALELAYDGPLVKELRSSGIVPGRVVLGHDERLYVASVAVEGGAPITYARNQDGDVVTAGPVGLEYEGGILSRLTAGMVRDDRIWNEHGEPLEEHVYAGSTEVYGLVLTRDDLGRVIGRSETIEGTSTAQSFEYTVGGRLNRVREGTTDVATASYDSNGNRTSYGEVSGSEEAHFDTWDRILEQGAITYQHDAEGRRTSRNDGGLTSYGFDGFHRLRWVDRADGTRVDYVLDGLHRRVGKRVDGVLTTGFVYSDERLVAELDGNGNVRSTFVYAGRSRVPEAFLRGGRTYRIITDHLGSPRLVIDIVSGQIVQKMLHDAWGRVLADTNPGFQPFGFAGGLYDPDTGLVQFGPREYDPETGRWMTRDPLGIFSGDVNLYAYVRGDPISSVDPSGLGPDMPSIESLAWKWNKTHPGEDTRWFDPTMVAEELGVPSLTREQMTHIDHINTSMQTLQYLIPINESDGLASGLGKRTLRLVVAIPSVAIPVGYEVGKAFDQGLGVDVFGRIAADTGSFNTPDTSRASITGLWRGVEGLFMSVATEK